MKAVISQAWTAGLALLVACASAEEIAPGSSDGSGGSAGSSSMGGAGSLVAGDHAGAGARAGSNTSPPPFTAGSAGATAGGGVGGGAGSSSSADASPTAADAPTSADGPRVDDAGEAPPPFAGNRFLVAYRTTSATQVQFEVSVTNTGSESPATRTLVVRYYLKTEGAPGAASIAIDSAAWMSRVAAPFYVDLRATCAASYAPFTRSIDAGPTMSPVDAGGADAAASTRDASADTDATGPSRDASVDAAGPVSGAVTDAVLDVSCASDQVLVPGASLNVQVRWSGSTATNDYSYQPGGELAPNERIVVLQGDVVVAGTPP